MPVLTVDDVKVEVPEGTSLLDACRQAGAKIPTLCYLEGVQAIGACRLCLVEVEGAKTLVASCAQPAGDGMVVKTNTRRAREGRGAPCCELILSEHDGDCYTCMRSGDCELRQLAIDLHITDIPYEGEKTRRARRLHHARSRARHRQVRILPALRHRLQRDPGRGRALPAGPRLHHRHRPGLRQ